MTNLNKLRKKRKTDNAVEHKLRLFTSDKKIPAILVVEGEEDSNLYAYAFHKVVSDSSVRVIICNGKGGVLGLRDFSADNFPNDTKAIFFIDKDHDDLLGLENKDERTYVTDHYSIEWDICTKNVLFKLIEDHYALNLSDPIWGVVRRKFCELMTSWLDHSRPVMQAVVVARRNGENLDLKQIMLSDICRFHGESLEHTGISLEDLLIKAGIKNCPAKEELDQCSRELRDCDDRLYIRGKLVVQFFCEFFRRLNKICGYPTKIDDQSLTTGVQIGRNNYVRGVLNIWTIPETLRKFFNDWKERQAV